MSLFYADASALAKLVLDEPESAALRAFAREDLLTSCEISVTEVLRALTRNLQNDPTLVPEVVREQATRVLDAIPLAPVEYELLVAAGRLPEPSLRALDAIHIAAALSLDGLDGFVTYDVRQAAGARLAGLRTFSPGA